MKEREVRLVGLSGRFNYTSHEYNTFAQHHPGSKCFANELTNSKIVTEVSRGDGLLTNANSGHKKLL